MEENKEEVIEEVSENVEVIAPEEKEVEEQPVENNNNDKKGNNKKLILIISLIAASLVVIGAVVLFLVFNNSDDDSDDNYNDEPETTEVEEDKKETTEDKTKEEETKKEQEKRNQVALGVTVDTSGFDFKKYNKDDELIKNLIKKIVYESGSTHDEDQLYESNKVTLANLSDIYKNSLVLLNISNSDKSNIKRNDFSRSSLDLFGEDIYINRPNKISALYYQYTYDNTNDSYTMKEIPGGGAGYMYYSYINRVATKDNYIYIFNKVAFQCGKADEWCKDVVRVYPYPSTNSDYYYFEGVNKIDDLKNNLDKLHEYMFTFKKNSSGDGYYFVSVEKLKN